VKNFLVVENESNNFESEIVTEILTEILTGKYRTENPTGSVLPTPGSLGVGGAQASQKNVPPFFPKSIFGDLSEIWTNDPQLSF